MYVKLHGIHKQFGTSVIFHDLNLEFSKCGLYFLTGESGSGKTTLLNIIAGYELAKGTRELSDDASIACIFQSYELIEEFTVRDNLCFYQDVFQQGRTAYSDRIIEELGLTEVLNHYPRELSGGQRQRVGIARALLLHPNMVICDEPTESLDIENKEKVLKLLKELSKTIIILISSHEKKLLEDCYDYHYEILDKTVVCTETRKNGTDCTVSPQKEILNKKMASRYLSKMIRKSTFVYTAVLCMILLGSVLFSQIKNQVFQEREYIHALNYNVVYLSAPNESEKDLETLIPVSGIEKVYLLTPFSLWYYEGKTYKPDLFPYVSNTSHVEITGKNQPEDRQVIINQYMADKMMERLNCSEKKLLGKELQFNYIVDKQEYPVTFEITGIAHEQDVNGRMILYYNYDYLKSLLQSQEYYPGMSLYDYLKEYQKEYAFETNDSLTSYSLFQRLDSRNKDVYHSIFSHLDSMGNQKEMYRIVFQFIQIILLVLTVFYLFFYSIKDMRKNSTNLSILVSLHLPMVNLKRTYFRKKIVSAFFPMVVVLLEIYCYGQLFEDNHVIIQYLYTAGAFILYLILLIVLLFRFRRTKISDILKDSKDR